MRPGGGCGKVRETKESLTPDENLYHYLKAQSKEVVSKVEKKMLLRELLLI